MENNAKKLVVRISYVFFFFFPFFVFEPRYHLSLPTCHPLSQISHDLTTNTFIEVSSISEATPGWVEYSYFP